MLFITVVINYLDRSNLSIAMPAIAEELDLSKAQQGLMLSAFGWTYAALQIPGGWLVDRVPPRVLYPVCADPLVGRHGLHGHRRRLRRADRPATAGRGRVWRHPAYPINNRVATAWFPERERATAIGFYTSGQFVGLAPSDARPVLAAARLRRGTWVFIATGVMGIGWGIAAVPAVPRTEASSSAPTTAEIALIEAGRRTWSIWRIARDRETRGDHRCRRGHGAGQPQAVGHLPGPVLPRPPRCGSS